MRGRVPEDARPGHAAPAGARPRAGHRRRAATASLAAVLAAVVVLLATLSAEGARRRAGPRTAQGSAAPAVARGVVRRPEAPRHPTPPPTGATPGPVAVRPVSGPPHHAERPCESPGEAIQQACFRARAAPGDVQLMSAYEDLMGAMRESAGAGWEPAAVRALRAEQQRWVAARARACRAQAPARPGATWGAARAACHAERAARRAADLRARRARFSPSPPGEPGWRD